MQKLKKFIYTNITIYNQSSLYIHKGKSVQKRNKTLTKPQQQHKVQLVNNSKKTNIYKELM